MEVMKKHCWSFLQYILDGFAISVADVSGLPIGFIFKGQNLNSFALEYGLDRWTRNVGIKPRVTYKLTGERQRN